MLTVHSAQAGLFWNRRVVAKGGGAHLRMGRGVIGPKQCTERKQRKLSTSGVMGTVSGLEGGFFISQLVHSLLFVFVGIYITFEF